MPPTDRLDSILNRLEQQGIRLGLEPLSELLSALGNPQDGLPAVLVAGTNGKGSTSALLESMARAAGYRTGLYTSPHLERVEERIQLGGRPIERNELTALLEEVVESAAVRGLELPTYFEALTAAALLAFRRADVELAVLEVGLGGRLDATNLAHPVLSVITGIAYDHEDHLGRTLGQIAREKAGILRSGRPALAQGGDVEVRRELLAAAAREGASLELVAETVQLRDPEVRGDRGLCVRIRTPVATYELETPLAGAHQLDNLALATRAAEVLAASGWERLDSRAIRQGAAAVRWPGRLERVVLPGGGSVLLDAAHNPAGVAALTAHLDRLGEPFDLLFGALADKRVVEMLPPLAQRARRVTLTRPPSGRAHDPEMLRPLVPETVEVACEPDHALALDRALAAGPDLLVCCGSIYLIGPIRTLLRLYTVQIMDSVLERAGERLLEDRRVLAVWGFGSRARGQFGGRRDVDLAVLLAQPLSLREELGLRAGVVEALRREDIDLVVLNDAPPILRYEVVTGGRLLGARDPQAVERLEDRALREYLDTAHLRRVQRRLTREALG